MISFHLERPVRSHMKKRPQTPNVIRTRGKKHRDPSSKTVSDFKHEPGPPSVVDALTAEAEKLGMYPRASKVWCDENTSKALPGDCYVDCMGTWLFDPDGTWRDYHSLTEAERQRCLDLIADERGTFDTPSTSVHKAAQAARLDADKKAKPLTEIVAVMPPYEDDGRMRTLHAGQSTHYVVRPTSKDSPDSPGQNTSIGKNSPDNDDQSTAIGKDSPDKQRCDVSCEVHAEGEEREVVISGCRCRDPGNAHVRNCPLAKEQNERLFPEQSGEAPTPVQRVPGHESCSERFARAKLEWERITGEPCYAVEPRRNDAMPRCRLHDAPVGDVGYTCGCADTREDWAAMPEPTCKHHPGAAFRCAECVADIARCELRRNDEQGEPPARARPRCVRCQRPKTEEEIADRDKLRICGPNFWCTYPTLPMGEDRRERAKLPQEPPTEQAGQNSVGERNRPYGEAEQPGVAESGAGQTVDEARSPAPQGPARNACEECGQAERWHAQNCSRRFAAPTPGVEKRACGCLWNGPPCAHARGHKETSKVLASHPLATHNACPDCDQVAGHSGSCVWTEEEVAAIHAKAEEIGRDLGLDWATPTPSDPEPWEFDGDCTRCNATMQWDGDTPETPEEAICVSCLETEVIELRKRVTPSSGVDEMVALRNVAEAARAFIERTLLDAQTLGARARALHHALDALPKGGAT